MESKKVESNAELTPFEKEFKVQLNLPAAYFSVFYAIYVVYMICLLYTSPSPRDS